MSPSSLSPLDVEKMRPYTIVKQLEKRITDDNHHETTVTILNPEEAYAEFPHHIGRFEVGRHCCQARRGFANLRFSWQIGLYTAKCPARLRNRNIPRRMG